MGAEKRAKVNASGRRIPMSALNNARGRRGTKERKFKVKPPSKKTLMPLESVLAVLFYGEGVVEGRVLPNTMRIKPM